MNSKTLTEKLCKKCDTVKPVSEFYRNYKIYISGYCKDCSRKYANTYNRKKKVSTYITPLRCVRKVQAYHDILPRQCTRLVKEGRLLCWQHHPKSDK